MDGTNLVGIDPLTGQQKFSVPLQWGTDRIDNYCPNQIRHDVASIQPYWSTDQLHIAGDGYMYLGYAVGNQYRTTTCDDEQNDQYGLIHSKTTSDDQYIEDLHVLRVNSSGENQDLPVHSTSHGGKSVNSTDRVQTGINQQNQPIFAYEYREEDSGGGTELTQFTDPLTNADQGAIVTWNQRVSPSFAKSTYTDVNGNVTTSGSVPGADYDEAHVTTINGSQVSSDNALQVAGTETHAYVRPVLQHENGDYIAWTSSRKLVAFNAAGEVKWTKEVLTGADPLYALADGSTVYREGVYRNIPKQLVTLDANGNELTRIPDNGIIQSRTGLAYKPGSTGQVELAPVELASNFASAIDASGTATLRYESPQSGLYTIANSDFLSNSQCSTFLDQLARIARNNNRVTGAGSITKEFLADQIKATAAAARNYIYDGPTSTEVMQLCDRYGCVDKFPIWMLDQAPPPKYTIGQWFNEDLSRRFALSQYNGAALWTQLEECGISDICVSWNGGWRNWGSPYISSFGSTKGKVNRYGLGLLFHEVLHKRDVGGGFKHAELDEALEINAPMDKPSRDYLADQIGKRCFPDAP